MRIINYLNENLININSLELIEGKNDKIDYEVRFKYDSLENLIILNFEPPVDSGQKDAEIVLTLKQFGQLQKIIDKKIDFFTERINEKKERE